LKKKQKCGKGREDSRITAGRKGEKKGVVRRAVLREKNGSQKIKHVDPINETTNKKRKMKMEKGERETE